MALAEKLLAEEFNRTNFPIVDHYTYAFVGDGCLMEGISHEVSSEENSEEDEGYYKQSRHHKIMHSKQKSLQKTPMTHEKDEPLVM